MITKTDWDQRQQEWAAFNRMRREEIRPERPPEIILDDIGALLEWAPAEVKAEERDPERRGVRRMQELLGQLSPR